MKSFYKLLSSLLILSMVLLPFSTQAAMIGTGDIVASANDQLNRSKVLDFASRADVQQRFEALGLNSATAQERVNAMTPDEINRIAGQIDSMPAGASNDGWWWAVGVIVIGAIIWYVYRGNTR
ncbi:MAG: hypothetical protein JWN94_28 [Betaproteobacteria bacterium]|nr:hypothetical protein [Betaproteobacteria bacterium]